MSTTTLTSDPAIRSYSVSPLAQTFRTTVDTKAGGKWVYAVKLLFATKSDPAIATSLLPYSGVTVEIRRTFNGYPMGPDNVLARTYQIADNINTLSTSATGLTAADYTTFVFLEPAFLQNDAEYAIVAYADGNTTDYLAWIGRVGETVFATNIQYSTQDNVTPGVLFLSTNQTTWTPIQTEDLVYDVQVLKFDQTFGDITLVPNDYEFISYNTFANKKFAFVRDTMVGQLTNSYGAGYFSANSGALLTGPIISLNRPLVDSTIDVGSFQISNTAGSANFTNFNSGSGIIILRIEPDMVKASPGSSGYTNIPSIPGDSTTITSTNTAALQVGDFVVIPNVSNTDYSNTLFSVGPNGQHFGCIRQVVAVANSSEFTIDAPVSSSAVTNTAFWVANNVKTFVTTVYSGNNTLIQLKDPIPREFVTASNGALFTAGSANIAYAYQVAPVGRIDGINSITNKMRIEGSTANTTIKFRESNSTYLGTLLSTSYTNTTSFSTAYANVTSIDQIAIDRVSSKVKNFAPLGTTIDSFVITNYSSTGNNTTIKKFNLNDTQVVTYDAVLKSKSLSPSMESLALKINLNSESNLSSPKVTFHPSSLFVSSAFINSNTTNENWANNAGAASAKYISKASSLNPELDAEDIFLYVTAYRPSGTDVKVYVKIRGREDTRKMDDIDWSELIIDTNADVYSSSSDLADYKEYRYTFRKKPQTVVVAGAASYTNATANLDGIGTTWSPTTFNALTAVSNTGDYIAIASNPFVNGDIVTYTVSAGNTAITGLTNTESYYVVYANSTALALANTASGANIDLTAGSSEVGHTLTDRSRNLAANDVIAIIDPSNAQVYDIGIVDSVANNTRLSLKSVLSDQGVFTTTTTGLTVEKLSYPTEAFKYYGNDSIVRYYDSNKAGYDGYQQFAIKVVMTRDRLGVVPYINDIRAIATSV